MRINLTQTKSMKRYLVYTTDDLRLRPFDPTRFFAPPPHENRQNTRPVEKVGLANNGAARAGRPPAFCPPVFCRRFSLLTVTMRWAAPPASRMLPPAAAPERAT